MVLVGRRVRFAIAALGAVAIGTVTAPARANSFVATELSYDAALLSQFNVISLGNLTATGSAAVGGRELVGGNASFGTNTVCTSTTACGNSSLAVTSSPTAVNTATTSSSNGNASATSPATYGYGALTVFGNISGSVAVGTTTAATGTVPAGRGGDIDVKGSVGTGTFALNNAGGVNLGGTSTSGTTATNITEYRTTQATPPSGSGSSTGTNFNSSNSGTSQSLLQVFAPFANSSAVSANFQTPLQNLYSGLANLPGTPGVKADALPSGQSGIFTSGVDYTANGKSYGVVTASLATFEAEGSSFTGVANNSSDAATFVIITGSGGTLPTITNADPKVIYDFVSASSLTTGSTFDGTILAPLANLVQGSGTINGSVVVASLTQDASILNTNAFTGDLSGLTSFSYNARVPEPASIALLGSGFAGLAWFRRRRSQRRR